MQRVEGAELSQFLSGWKEIASYLGKGVRTVQRYELAEGLPIHRLAGKSTGAVIATKAELDGWVANTPTRADLKPKGGLFLNNKTNRIGADFLRVDAEIALTFSGMALAASDPEKRRRTARSARKAYDTIVRLREDIHLSGGQSDSLDALLQRLKNELQSIGQRF